MAVADNKQLQDYLHARIPLSKAMGVAVESATINGVELSAPLAPNINHRETVFGGSICAVAILSAWMLVHLRLKNERLDCRIVIQSNTMHYERPIAADFTASSLVPDAAVWDRFVKTLKRKQRARISVHALLHCRGKEVGRFQGEFVAVIG